MSHTPGPWLSSLDKEQDVSIFGRGWILATVYDNADNSERDHNARLIAAAPELLAELQKNADTFAEFAKVLNVYGKHTMAAAARVAEDSNRAIIRKAEGA